MKKLILSIFLIGICINLNAKELINGVTKYSESSIKELKLDSMSDLLVNYFNENKLTPQAVNKITYLADGQLTQKSSEEKNSLQSAESVELLLNNKTLIVNVISRKNN
ncbi:hypothetical protein [Shewanella sp. MBTL60-007]|uniref:hypothetical protein n=1 Tax=Shewanella sp. MBTL60-007 TaxID=2815911 RepID=UPI001BBD7E75|nr:hypothetical protein [Shewanella sp. MBTL60-007]GIU18468.1 hypothetical protein TUM3792_14610 [Shewanella sp. MBTL60-007]